MLQGLRPKSIGDYAGNCDGCEFQRDRCGEVPCVPAMELDGKRLGEFVIWVKQE